MLTLEELEYNTKVELSRDTLNGQIAELVDGFITYYESIHGDYKSYSAREFCRRLVQCVSPELKIGKNGQSQYNQLSYTKMNYSWMGNVLSKKTRTEYYDASIWDSVCEYFSFVQVSETRAFRVFRLIFDIDNAIHTKLVKLSQFIHERDFTLVGERIRSNINNAIEDNLGLDSYLEDDLPMAKLILDLHRVDY